ncbi:preQ0 transporter [Azospirillum sp. TSO22-1]|uniref:preQ0 transporter n=1 Tax=Azospirillum sp. TSO22-1 TaxID=716789 RepID=UPI000D62273C|nr:preQ0 transporter [Azospirillum sp. TSO22-1]PWC41375.1 preQ0 transporter [Azospirillum sp. TSO22-1]
MIWLAAYIGSVVAINYAFSMAPHLDLVWSCWVGFIFILRDMVQVRFGHGSLAAMAAGSVLSYLLADPFVALASVAAFAVSETIDWAVFTVTRRPLRDRLWLSAALSVPADTAIFFGMIGVWSPAVWTASIASKLAGVTAVWLLMRAREGRAYAAA